MIRKNIFIYICLSLFVCPDTYRYHKKVQTHYFEITVYLSKDNPRLALFLKSLLKIRVLANTRVQILNILTENCFNTRCNVIDPNNDTFLSDFSGPITFHGVYLYFTETIKY